VLVAGDGVPHQGLEAVPKGDEHETVAAPKALEALAHAGRQREASGVDTVGGLQGGHEGQTFRSFEETEQWRVAAVVEAEAAEEAGVGDEASPALADGGGAGEGRRLRGEADEDLAEEVVVVQRTGH
jgi:hypothetical protein